MLSYVRAYANLEQVLFFLTLFLLGLSSSFAMMDVAVTTICDAPFTKRYPRIFWSSLVCVVCFLISLIYTTQFGFYLLDGIDVVSFSRWGLDDC